MVAQVAWFALLDLFVHIIEMSYIDSRVKFDTRFFSCSFSQLSSTKSTEELGSGKFSLNPKFHSFIDDKSLYHKLYLDSPLQALHSQSTGRDS